MSCLKPIIIMLYQLRLLLIPPNSHLLTSDTGIANSSASGFYFAPGAHVANINIWAPAIGVEVVNGLPVCSIASATLASVPSLSAAAMQGHVMPLFSHTLVGLGPFADQGCQIVFTKDDVIVIDLDGQCILQGWRKKNGAQLWHFPLKAPPACIPSREVRPTTLPAELTGSHLHPSKGLDAFDEANQACSVTYRYRWESTGHLQLRLSGLILTLLANHPRISTA